MEQCELDREIRNEIQRCHALIHLLRKDPELQRREPGLLQEVEDILQRSVSMRVMLRNCEKGLVGIALNVQAN